jgi:hypothetical protein
MKAQKDRKEACFCMPKITREQLLAAVEDNMFGMGGNGFCLACGAEVGGVEPDARKYTCECCGEKKVYGADEILLMVGG